MQDNDNSFEAAIKNSEAYGKEGEVVTEGNPAEEVEGEVTAEVETEEPPTEEVVAETSTETETTPTEVEEENEVEEAWYSKFTEEQINKEREELETLRKENESYKKIGEDDEFTKGYKKHLENGGKAQTYLDQQIQLQKLDLDTMDKEEMVKQAYLLDMQSKGLDKAEAEEEWIEYSEDKFFDEDTKERKLKIAAVDARAQLEAHKMKMAEPYQNENTPQPLTPEQLEANKKANEDFVAKYDKEVSTDLTFKVGEKEITLKDKGNYFKAIEKQFTTTDPYADWRTDTGDVDVDNYAKAMYMAKNGERLIAAAYKQGQADKEINTLQEARNPRPKDHATGGTESPLVAANLAAIRKMTGE